MSACLKTLLACTFISDIFANSEVRRWALIPNSAGYCVRLTAFSVLLGLGGQNLKTLNHRKDYEKNLPAVVDKIGVQTANLYGKYDMST